jgi:Uma2 family endonuclease
MSVITPTRGGEGPPPFPGRFTVDEYHRMIQSGFLTENDPVELVDGRIIQKMARNPPHDGTIGLTQDTLKPLLPTDWRIRIQSAITTPDSEPEPDLAVVRGSLRDWTKRHPGPPEIGTLIEVADSSLDFDRTVKGPSYARAAIAIYWIINLVESKVEVYTDPTGPDPKPRYRKQQDYFGSDFIPLVLGGQEVGKIAVKDLLP